MSNIVVFPTGYKRDSLKALRAKYGFHGEIIQFPNIMVTRRDSKRSRVSYTLESAKAFKKVEVIRKRSRKDWKK